MQYDKKTYANGEPFEIKAKKKTHTKKYTLTNSVKQALLIIGTSNSHDNSTQAILCFALDNSYFYFVLSYNTFLLSNKTSL
jgi:hypothetical protein